MLAQNNRGNAETQASHLFPLPHANVSAFPPSTGFDGALRRRAQGRVYALSRAIKRRMNAAPSSICVRSIHSSG